MIKRIKRQAARVAAENAKLDALIAEGRQNGKTLREIAEAANLSPEWVRRIAEGTASGKRHRRAE